ncbi:MAG: hypothetical protein ACF8R7_00535 [Phycisphaerales bacterium JB039]
MSPLWILAWRPFLDPLPLEGTWFLLLAPLALLISMGYKAVRVPNMERYWRDVLVMTMQVIIFMILLWIGSYLLIFRIVPLILPQG